MTDSLATNVRFGDDGLVPAVVQDVATGDVLMLAWMSEDALRLTRETGRAHYWSRSRQQLWRKGETSGHEQLVAEIRLNCERNSLLLLVQQMGAVCHDGYPTCYYRRLEPDDALIVVRERAFDPNTVYAGRDEKAESTSAVSTDPIGEATRRQFGAYAYLRDNPLEDVSATSRRLRGDEALHGRLADELIELAGVLEGQHRHTDHASDLRLEASQAMYWLLLLLVRNGTTWNQLRPDRALATGSDLLTERTMARLLRADAAHWMTETPTDESAAARGHATLELIAQACRAGGADPLAAIEADLAELATRPYLAPYFLHRAPFHAGHD